MRKLICLCCLLWAIPACASDLELDLECLQEGLPRIHYGHAGADPGGACVVLTTERRTSSMMTGMKICTELLENADIEDAMRQRPLEPERRISRPMRSRGASAVIPCSRLLYGRFSSVERGIVRTLFGGRLRCALRPASAKRSAHRRGVEIRPADPTEQLFFAHLLLARHQNNRLSPTVSGLRWISIQTRVRIGNGANSPASATEDLPPPSSHSLRTTASSGAESGSISTMHFGYCPRTDHQGEKLRAQANGKSPKTS